MAIIETQPLTSENLSALKQFDSSFRVDSILILRTEAGMIIYEQAPVSPYIKRYPPEEIEPSDYLGHQDRTIYLAFLDSQPAGRIVLRKNWNGYAYIQDIVVDPKHRRVGVGRALVRRAFEWAKERSLPGLMLETQNNNVPACLFYERLGFQLGGFDRFLYRGLTPDTEEIALYWYLVFS